MRWVVLLAPAAGRGLYDGRDETDPAWGVSTLQFWQNAYYKDEDARSRQRYQHLFAALRAAAWLKQRAQQAVLACDEGARRAAWANASARLQALSSPCLEAPGLGRAAALTHTAFRDAAEAFARPGCGQEDALRNVQLGEQGTRLAACLVAAALLHCDSSGAATMVFEPALGLHRWDVVAGLAQRVARQQSRCRVLEVGVWTGWTAEHVLKRVPEAEVVGVDPYLEGPQPREEAERRLRPFGKRAQIWRTTSEEAAARPGPCFDVVFLDALKERTKEDLQAWLPKVCAGGVLAGHDYRLPFDRDVAEQVHSLALRRGLAVHLGSDWTWWINVDGEA